MTSAEVMLKSVWPTSVATALTRWVLPVPGGPYMRMAFGGFLLPWNQCGNWRGKMTASLELLLGSLETGHLVPLDLWRFRDDGALERLFELLVLEILAELVHFGGDQVVECVPQPKTTPLAG
jgi:hypothetical protein